MKRMILYGICVLLCFAFCGCSKRKATVEDEEKITELATKFNQAERNDDIPGMLKFANEMYSYASKLEPDEKGKRLLAGAYTKLGIVYSSQDKRAEAFKAWDTAISITPDADTIIYVYCLKLSDFWSQKYAEERNEIMEACRRGV